jgi:hypothetical protein
VATESIQSSASLQDLTLKISRQLDTNKDGQLSVSEFSQFLGAFVGTTPPSASRASAASTATRPAIGTMAGFDAGKMIDPSVDTTKYRIGRILQGYPNTPDGLRQALPEIQQIVPGATITGSLGDKLDFGAYVDHYGYRIGVIDVIQAATPTGGYAWQWLPVE